MSRRILLLVVAAASLSPTPAAADWIVSPYIGARFAGSTTFVVGREGTEQNKLTFGSSVGILTDRILGVEADLAFVPGFFEGLAVTQGSRVITLMGNVLLATPLDLTQYGLRPYAVGGIGLMHAKAKGDPLDFFSSNLLAMNIGGGAIGPISPRSSLRFDVRYFRSLTDDPDAITAGDSGVELSFWRGTVGLTFRF